MNHFIYRKKRKILLAAISMGVLAASISAFHGPEAVYAYTATAGTINDTALSGKCGDSNR